MTSATWKAALMAAVLGATGCWHHGRGFGLFEAAIVTAAVVSLAAPPPPRVVVVPAERPGYSWQPGYWTRDGDDWVWVEGRWIALPPHYRWAPSHWEQAPDGSWHLLPGHWVPA
jgi:hypothetical protein